MSYIIMSATDRKDQLSFKYKLDILLDAFDLFLAEGGGNAYVLGSVAIRADGERLVIFPCDLQGLFIVVLFTNTEIELESVNVIGLGSAILASCAVRMRLNYGNSVRFQMLVELLDGNIEYILAQLEKFARYAVKQIVILVEGELDREKNGQTDTVAFCFCLEISIAKFIHLLCKSQILTELLEVVGRKVIGNNDGIVARFLEESDLLDGC